MTRIADDTNAIAARLREMRGMRETPKPQTVCPRCEGGGWVEIYSPRPPAFEVCPECFNPEGYPCP